MDWRGIEWLLPIFQLAILILPVYCFVNLRKRVLLRIISKWRAFCLYLGSVISPIIFYVIFFFALIGIEEITEAHLITEGIARSFFMVLALGGTIWFVSTTIFAIVPIYVKQE